MSSNRLLAGNLIYLLIAEFVRGVLQALFIKHISTSLGTEQYGVYISVFNIINLSMIVVNSGLELYGIKEVAKFPEKSAEIVGNILSLRLILYVFTLFGLLIYISQSFLDPNLKELYYIATIKLLGEALLLNWFFQGKENMKPVAIRQVFLHLTLLIFFLYFIDGPEDIKAGVWIFSITNPVVSLMMLAYYLKNNKIKINLNLEKIKSILKQALPMGVMLFMIIIYTRSDIEVIKFMADDPDKVIGLYGTMTAIVVVSAMPTNIFQQIIFPKLTKSELISDRVKNYNFFLNISLFTGIALSIIFFVFSKELILLLHEQEYLEGNLLLKLLSVKIFLIYVAVASSSPLIAWGKQKAVMYITILSAAINIIGNLIFVPKYSMYGAAATTLFSEILVAVLFGYVVFKMVKTLNLKLIIKYLFFGLFFGLLSNLAYNNTNTIIIPIFVTLLLIYSLFAICSTIKLKEILALVKK